MASLEEPDRIDGLAVAVVFVATLLASAACVGIALWLLRAGAAPNAERAASAPRAAPSTVSAVPIDLFARPAAGSSARREPARLRSYGWVDRERGLVHIPVERAIDLYVSQTASGP